MNVKKIQLSVLRSYFWFCGRWTTLVKASPTPPEAIAGGEAYERGLRIADNPYPPDTKQHEDWAWGFEESQNFAEYRPNPETYV